MASWTAGRGQLAKGFTLQEHDTDSAGDLVAQAEALGARAAAARTEIARVIFGQEDVIEQVLVTLLSGGHALLVGVPGLGKTLLVETLGTVLGLAPKRVQFTPDLMPADITGSEVLDEDETGRRSFRFVPGPVFCQLLMADEINRASPRTQSALLQAMQEGRVAVSGEDHPLPRPFHVLATQNPIEQEGTYPLPEAQLDRFLLQVDVGYPSLEAERTMLLATTGAGQARARPLLTGDELMAAQRLIRRVLPDVLVKGGDYREDQIAGADAVRAAGGSVRVLDFVPGHSTTQMIRRIMQTSSS